ncbi:hypothetical protein DPEC_G00195670 [Dallia pectoralis]|uniref:Uncharacterized protein n=1 Tax=Dallia pectoralis TaxID=75939 RepID=A0ACC2G7X7_DALPE|nr:hypothetical protein DPEC_G00195670 [Dallia pectoralis]
MERLGFPASDEDQSSSLCLRRLEVSAVIRVRESDDSEKGECGREALVRSAVRQFAPHLTHASDGNIEGNNEDPAIPSEASVGSSSPLGAVSLREVFRSTAEVFTG